jgi:hypothetical protein
MTDQELVMTVDDTGTCMWYINGQWLAFNSWLSEVTESDAQRMELILKWS